MGDSWQAAALLLAAVPDVTALLSELVWGGSFPADVSCEGIVDFCSIPESFISFGLSLKSILQQNKRMQGNQGHSDFYLETKSSK